MVSEPALIGQEDTDRDKRIWRRGYDEAKAEPRRDLLVLLHAFADVPEAVRLLKIAEEYGEAAQALIDLRAWNPRKGQSGSHEEVAKEIADVVITSLVALGAFEVDPLGFALDHLRSRRERHEREVVND